MQTIHWFTEGVTLHVAGARSTEYLNTLARYDLSFSCAEREEEDALILRISGLDCQRALELAAEQGLQGKVLRRRGTFSLLRRFRSHLALLLAPLLLLGLLLRLSSRIWELEIRGNQSLTDAEIRNALAELGVKPGVSGLHLDNELLRSGMQGKLHELIFLTIQVNGSKAVVLVRERRKAPELLQEDKAADVFAAKTGQLVRLSVLEGRAAVRRGETVLEGELLISGSLSDLQNQTREVHALGDAWARTWYEAAAEMPLGCTLKRETGQEREKIAWKIGNLRLNFYADSGISYAVYDKMTTETRWTLLGMPLPFSTVRTRYREYEPIQAELPKEQAEGLLRERLLQWLSGVSGCKEPGDCRWESRAENGALRVSMTAECMEQIGVVRERNA